MNHEQRLYVIPYGNGFTCLGFDVAERKRRAVLEWMGESVPLVEVGTEEAFAAYNDAMKRGAAFAKATGRRCNAELTPQLIGLEGYRVEVNGRRFWVGKSTGWMPIHLEILRRNSSGGCGVYISESDTVRVVRRS